MTREIRGSWDLDFPPIDPRLFPLRNHSAEPLRRGFRPPEPEPAEEAAAAAARRMPGGGGTLDPAEDGAAAAAGRWAKAAGAAAGAVAALAAAGAALADAVIAGCPGLRGAAAAAVLGLVLPSLLLALLWARRARLLPGGGCGCGGRRRKYAALDPDSGAAIELQSSSREGEEEEEAAAAGRSGEIVWGDDGGSKFDDDAEAGGGAGLLPEEDGGLGLGATSGSGRGRARRGGLLVLKAATVTWFAAALAFSAGFAYIAGRARGHWGFELETGELAAAGLREPVNVEVEASGMLHIRAGSDHDMYFAQGWTQAGLRLWQIEFFKRVAAGRLSEFLGATTSDTDVFFRTLNFRGWSEAALAAYGDSAAGREARAAGEAFCAGFNAYLGRGRPLPFEFWLLGIEPSPCTLVDLVVMGKVLSLDLGKAAKADLRRWIALTRKGVSLEEIERLYPPYPGNETYPTVIADAELAGHPGAAGALNRTFWRGSTLAGDASMTAWLEGMRGGEAGSAQKQRRRLLGSRFRTAFRGVWGGGAAASGDASNSECTWPHREGRRTDPEKLETGWSRAPRQSRASRCWRTTRT